VARPLPVGAAIPRKQGNLAPRVEKIDGVKKKLDKRKPSVYFWWHRSSFALGVLYKR
jgi:hypothetical protein